MPVNKRFLQKYKNPTPIYQIHQAGLKNKKKTHQNEQFIHKLPLDASPNLRIFCIYIISHSRQIVKTNLFVWVLFGYCLGILPCFAIFAVFGEILPICDKLQFMGELDYKIP
jgi:hypothetical protein